MALITDQNNLLSLVKLVELNSTSKLSVVLNTYYKMQGFNTSTNQYEDWHSVGTALITPPSGNALINISVIASWIDR